MNTLDARRRLLGRNVYKKTVEGNPAIAQGSLARMYPGITMQGWTEQDSTTGAQLFDASNLPTKSVGGVTVTNNGDGSFTVSGEGEISAAYTNSVYMTAGEYPTLKEGSISMVCDRTIPYFFFQLQDENNSVILNIASSRDAQKTAEITQDILQRVNRVVAGFYGSAGESIEPGTIKPMVYQTGEGTYEPYTGRQPSPSPDYPQEIVSAGNWNEEAQKWEYEAEVGCGQLLNFQENNVTSYGITCEFKIDTITINGTKTNGDGGRLFYKTNDFVLQPGTYTFSYEVVNDINSTISGIFLTKKDSNEVLGRTFTLNESTEVYIGTNIYEARQENDVVVRCMLNTGSTPLPYTPYRPPQTVTLTADRPLTKWDKLEKRNGQWGWAYKSNEIVLDGSEDEVWELYKESTTQLISFQIDLQGDTTGSQVSLCDKYINKYGAWYMDRYGIYSDHEITQYKYFRPPSAEVQTVEQWRTWLSENPLTLWYETAEETFVSLSESEQELMNALHTFRPTTVLSNDCDCNMILTYKTKKSMGGVIS